VRLNYLIKNKGSFSTIITGISLGLREKVSKDFQVLRDSNRKKQS
jgi:hypothetical protein